MKRQNSEHFLAECMRRIPELGEAGLRNLLVNLFSGGTVPEEFRNCRFSRREYTPGAVGPEILGLLCERLRGGRRSGTVYTPHEIAERMCRGSLAAWLGPGAEPLFSGRTADLSASERNRLLEKLRTVRVCDPAAGAGEFLLRMAELLLECRMRLGAEPPEEIRRGIAERNLFGMDLDPEALETARSRLALAGFPVRNRLERGDSLSDLEGRSFDLVIGNPPYLSPGLRGSGTLSRKTAERLRAAFPGSAEYKISLFALFMELAVRLTDSGGIQSFIVPDSFLLGRYYSKIRRTILEQNEILRLELVRGKVFGTRTVGSCVIYLFRKDGGKNPAVELIERCGDACSVPFRLPQTFFESRPGNRFQLFFRESDFLLAQKIESGAKPLSGFLMFSSGLIGRHGQDSITSKVKKSAFWKPGIASGSAVLPFRIDRSGRCFLNTEKRCVKSGLGKARFSEPKLFLRQTGDSLVCAYDSAGLLALNNVHVGNAVGSKRLLKAAACILNSKMMNWYYRTVSLERHRALAQIDIDALNRLPMRLPERAAEELERLYGRMESGTGTADELESAVCALYGLTEQERRIIGRG